jgi:hypothetical protein
MRNYIGFLYLVGAIIPSGVEEVHKYLGLAGVGLYVVATAALLAAIGWIAQAFSRHVTQTQAAWLTLLTLTAVFLVFYLVYPIANSGRIGGGSDSDDALNLATQALLNSEYPYAVRTYLGAPATYLPGSLLLAVPFTVLGNAAYQNIFWISALFLAARSYLKDTRHALIVLWLTLLCPRVWQSLVTGGELLASSIYLPIFVLLALGEFGKVRSSRWLGAVLLGVGLSSRVNFLLLCPVLWAASVQKYGWKSTILFGAVALTVFLGITLPFWIHDPAQFWVACFSEQNFAAARLTSVVAGADVLLPLASVVFAFAVLFMPIGNGTDGVLLRCALTQAFPVVMAVVLSSIETRSFNLFYARYGVHFLFFSALAYCSSAVFSLTVSTSEPPTATMAPMTTSPIVKL